MRLLGAQGHFGGGSIKDNHNDYRRGRSGCLSNFFNTLFFNILIFLKDRSPTVKMSFGNKMPQQPKAKYLIPRDPHLRSAYRTSKLYRAKLKIHAVWAFGSVLHVGILEETTFHGSSMVWDLIATTLEYVIAEYRRKQIAEPDTLIVVGDNTVKELKNSVCLMGLANLVNHGKLRFLVFKSSCFCWFSRCNNNVVVMQCGC